MKSRIIVETYVKVADGFVDFFEFQGEERRLDQIEGLWFYRSMVKV